MLKDCIIMWYRCPWHQGCVLSSHAWLPGETIWVYVENTVWLWKEIPSDSDGVSNICIHEAVLSWVPVWVPLHTLDGQQASVDIFQWTKVGCFPCLCPNSRDGRWHLQLIITLSSVDWQGMSTYYFSVDRQSRINTMWMKYVNMHFSKWLIHLESKKWGQVSIQCSLFLQ